MNDWIEVATEMFNKHRREANKWASEDVAELALISAGKATVLSELLEKFGVNPLAPH